MNTNVSAPVLEVLHGLVAGYRLTRIAAIIGGPFGTNIAYSMQRLRKPSFTAYPYMLAHKRSMDSYNDPNGDGLWIKVIGNAQELFRERENWENWHLFRYARISCSVWWVSLFVLALACLCVLGAENEEVGLPLAWACGAAVLASLAGATLSDKFADWVYKRNIASFEGLSSTLPDKLWPVIDEMHRGNGINLTKET